MQSNYQMSSLLLEYKSLICSQVNEAYVFHARLIFHKKQTYSVLDF